MRSNYVIIVERTCTSESMNPRPCFNTLQYRLRSLLSLVTLLFLYFQITKTYIYHPQHLYHDLFAELVHLYNLPFYWVCWGHKRLFSIWLQGCLRETIFILCLPWIDKPQVNPLEGNFLLSYKPLHLEAQRCLQEKGCVVDIRHQGAPRGQAHPGMLWGPRGSD